MFKEWLEAQVKAFIKKQITDENVTSIITTVLEKLKARVDATPTKIDDAGWYIANVLLTDPVVIHELVKLIQEGFADADVIDVKVSK